MCPGIPPNQTARSDQPSDHEFELADLIDAAALQQMMNHYYAITGIGIGIIDLKGHVLVGTGWQDICTRFHRVFPESCALCHESDRLLSSGVEPGTFKAYRCKNLMWDVSTPITIEGRHLGNIFLGQFFYDDEKIDLEAFRLQARKFGYNEVAYLEALDRVPRFSHATVENAMKFYSTLAQLISRMGYTNLKLKKEIVERLNTEDALRRSRALLKGLISSTSDAIYIKDTHGRYLLLNPAAERMTGRKAEEVLGHDAHFISSTQQADALMKDDREILESGHAQTREERITDADGRILTFLTTKGPLQDENGNRIGLFGISRDITARKREEELLRENEESLRYIIEQSPLSIQILDPKGTTLKVSKSFEQLWGASSEDLQNYNILKDRQLEKLGLMSYIRKAFEGEFVSIPAREYDAEKTIGKGHRRWISSSAYPVKDDKGNVRRVVLIHDDITDRKHAESAILEAKVAAERALKVKSRFLDIAAHELRTPVTALSLALELARRQAAKGIPVQTETLDRINAQLRRLNRLVVDLLDSSSLERGVLKLQRTPSDLVELVTTCVEEFSAFAPKMRIVLRKPKAPLQLDIDPVRINQVLANFIDNAIKYSVEGSVIEVAIHPLSSWVRVSVTDHGAGIPQEQRSEIFKPFTRGQSDREQKTSGLGLGLFVSQAIIELHDGKIGFESRVGVGSTFYFDLPCL